MADWAEQHSLETAINIWLAVMQWTPAMLSGPLEELMCSIVYEWTGEKTEKARAE